MSKRFNRLICVVIPLMIMISGMAYGMETKVISDLLGIFRHINVAYDEEVRGSAVAIFGNIDVQGKVKDDVVAVFGNVSINGDVEGNVVTVFGGIKLTSNGRIQGDAVQVLGGRISEEPGSVIGGARLSIGSFSIPGVSGFAGLLLLIMSYTIIKLIVGYVMSIIALGFFPQRFQNMSHSASMEVGRKFLIGIMVVIGFYVLTAMLFMVVLGIPFVLLLTPLMILLGFTGNTAVKLAIGNKMGLKLGKNWSQLTALTMGTLVYALIDLTIIGKSVTFLAKTVGIGAVIDTKVGMDENIPPKMGFIPINKDETIGHINLDKKIE